LEEAQHISPADPLLTAFYGDRTDRRPQATDWRYIVTPAPICTGNCEYRSYLNGCGEYSVNAVCRRRFSEACGWAMAASVTGWRQWQLPITLLSREISVETLQPYYQVRC
jgi:hypothetical protein